MDECQNKGDRKWAIHKRMKTKEVRKFGGDFREGRRRGRDERVADKGRRSFPAGLNDSQTIAQEALAVNIYLCVIRMIAEGVERMGFVDLESQRLQLLSRRLGHLAGQAPWFNCKN
jgi:hypothetical protein